MKKCAIIIGVNRTGELQPLSAATKGARDVYEWSLSQGFEAHLHVDDDDTPVKVAQIKDSIRYFVDQQTYSLMLIYFAGHGVLKSALDEKWLLSGAPDDVDEAVNVQASRLLSRRSKIPHIVFISDACRSATNNSLVTEVTGSVIFPNIPVGTSSADVDIFYATMAGDPSFEIKPDKAVDIYKGIFTDRLVYALKGNVDSIARDIDEGLPAILSYELSEYLKNAVPMAAADMNIILTQNPDAEIASRPPKHLARVSRPRAVEERRVIMDFSKEVRSPQKKYITFNKQFPDKGNQVKLTARDIPYYQELLGLTPEGRNDFLTAMAKLQTNTRRFNGNYTGFIVAGAKQVEVSLASGSHEVTKTKDNAYNIRLFNFGQSQTLLLKINGATSTPLAILPDFIGIIFVENEQIVNVNYSPSSNNLKYESGLINEEVDNRRAFIATKAKFGIFKLDQDPMSLIETASYLRQFKAFDPTLGLYASYAYARAGYFDNISSIYWYMSMEPEPVLFDVSMFEMLHKDMRQLPPSAPFCPMLTQGWSYLSADYDKFSMHLKELARFTTPGLWTAFNKKGSDLVESLISNKQIT